MLAVIVWDAFFVFLFGFLWVWGASWIVVQGGRGLRGSWAFLGWDSWSPLALQPPHKP